jgi:tyrosyl-tRNA synthetase
MSILEELKWRGLIQSSIGNLKSVFNEENPCFYVGTDPTSSISSNNPQGKGSLHVGHLLAFLTARLLQKRGFKPLVVVGGATAAMGDPSFKATERALLSYEKIEENAKNIVKQISKILSFDGANKAEILNNYDWMKEYSFINFGRNIGKYITVNYLMAKDSVQNRLSREGNGLSFTEFSYGLIQANDWLHLYRDYGCHIQIGGSDQLGNITTGQELIRKVTGSDKDICAFVWPLITRADGTKFGKSEGGKNIWLDAELTSPYEFYQFWLNQSDKDAQRFIKMYTMITPGEYEEMMGRHMANPTKHIFQKELAKELTCLIHSEKDYEDAKNASETFFSANSAQTISEMDEKAILSTFKNAPKFTVTKEIIKKGITAMDLTVSNTSVFSSRCEFRNLVKSGGISINGCKLKKPTEVINEDSLINGKYILLQKGKKTYNLIVAE